MASHTCRGKLPRLLFRATAATVMSLRILRFHRFQALHGNSISILRLSLSRTRLSQLSKLKTSRVARQWLRCPRTIITQSFKSGARNEWFCSKPIIPIKLKKSISNWLFFTFPTTYLSISRLFLIVESLFFLLIIISDSFTFFFFTEESSALALTTRFLFYFRLPSNIQSIFNKPSEFFINSVFVFSVFSSSFKMQVLL